MVETNLKDTVVVLSGAGISADSGLKTFRDDDGLWREHSFYELASPEGWSRKPEIVLEFYNERRELAHRAQPNPAHRAIAELEPRFNVVVVTQNVDDLHERAGSSEVIHLHGELSKVRSSTNSQLVYEVGCEPTRLGDLCEEGSQLRPHVVWFGERVMDFDRAIAAARKADKFLVVGTSLSVYPAASLLDLVPEHCEKVLVTKEVAALRDDFQWLKGDAATWVPRVVARWMK